MKLKRAPRHQSGFVYYRNRAWHVRYYARELLNDVVQSIQRSSKILSDPKHHLTKTNLQLQDARQAFMSQINDETGAGNPDMLITGYWNNVYLPFIREHKRESTVSGYEQIWSQHLRKHFEGKTLQGYRTFHGSKFLLSLTATQGLRTLNHIRSLISGIFAHALNTGRISSNPGHGIKILGKVKEPAKTEHYTLEEAEDMISALKDHTEGGLEASARRLVSSFPHSRARYSARLEWIILNSHFL